MQKVNTEDARSHLDELVEAALNGEVIYIAPNDRMMIQLVPKPVSPRRPQFGSAKGLITIADDFDEPLSDFRNYSG